MAESRTWAWIAVGAVGGAMGTYAWQHHRGKRRGKIYKIGDDYLVQAIVADDLAARVPGSRERDGLVVIPLGHRGTLVLSRAREDAGRLGVLYRLTLREPPRGPADALENILTEFVGYGLAIPGERFASWTTVGGPGQPLALNFRAPVRDSDLPEQRRPHGHYFKVKDVYYADERMLETMEGIPGSEPSDKGRSVTIPIWKRGELHFALVTEHTLFPEQRGHLYRLESRLTGVALEDFLVELIQIGLVGWGGEWERLPTKIAQYPRTGTPPWIAAGHVAILHGDAYLDEPVLAFLRTRVATQASLEDFDVTWRDHTFLLRPVRDVRLRDQRGTLYNISHAGESEFTAFLDELVLRRLATWSEQSERQTRRPTP